MESVAAASHDAAPGENVLVSTDGDVGVALPVRPDDGATVTVKRSAGTGTVTVYAGESGFVDSDADDSGSASSVVLSLASQACVFQYDAARASWHVLYDYLSLPQLDARYIPLFDAYQPLDSDLSAIAALSTSPFGRALLELVDDTSLRVAAGLVIGTDVEAHDSDLTAIAGLTATNDDVIQRKAGAWTNRTTSQLIADLAALGTTFQPLDSDLTAIAALATTSYGRALLTMADAAATKTALALVKADVGLGSVDNTADAAKNVATAAALTTARTIDGVSFDGTANITTNAESTHAASSKTTPVDADEIGLVDSAASNVWKKLTWANLKATLKANFDTLYDAIGAAASAQAASQPLDSDLTAIAALSTTSFGRALLALADAAALRTTGGLVIGTDVEAHDADLTAIAGLTPTNDDVVQRKSGAWTNRTMAQLISDLAALGTTFQPLDSDLSAIAALSTTSYGRSLLVAADAAAARTTLGLGTLATQSGTFSGTSSGTNTGDQTVTLTGDVTGTGTGSFAATVAAGAVTLAKTGTNVWTKGANVASANNLAPGSDGDLFHITGTTQINLLAATNFRAGSHVRLIFDGALTVKHNQTVSGANKPIILLAAADLVTAANDTIELVYDGTSWYQVGQTKVSGNAGTATALATSRNIDGQAFDGTAAITVIAPGTHAATSKATPVDADEIPLVDSAASNVLKKLTWANLKATLGTAPIVYQSGAAVAHTGDTVNTALATIAIPAGTILANGSVEITAFFTRNGSGTSNVQAAIYFGASGAGTGGTALIALANVLSTAQLSSLVKADFANANSASAQIAFPFTLAAGPFNIPVATTNVTAAINTGNASEIVISGKCVNSGDTITLKYYRVVVYPKA